MANLWTGTLSNAWALAGNWSLLHIPAAAEDVVVDDANLAGLAIALAVGPTVDVSVASFTVNSTCSVSLSHLTVTGAASLTGCTILGTPIFNGPTLINDGTTIGNGSGGGTYNGAVTVAAVQATGITIDGGTWNVPMRFSAGQSFDSAVFNYPVIFDGSVGDTGINCTFNSDVTLAAAGAGLIHGCSGTLHHFAGGVTGGAFTHIVSRAAAFTLNDGDAALDLTGCLIEIDGHLTLSHQNGQAGVTTTATTEIYKTRPHAKVTVTNMTYNGRIIRRTGALRGRGHSRRGR